MLKRNEGSMDNDTHLPPPPLMNESYVESPPLPSLLPPLPLPPHLPFPPPHSREELVHHSLILSALEFLVYFLPLLVWNTAWYALRLKTIVLLRDILVTSWRQVLTWFQIAWKMWFYLILALNLLYLFLNGLRTGEWEVSLLIIINLVATSFRAAVFTGTTLLSLFPFLQLGVGITSRNRKVLRFLTGVTALTFPFSLFQAAMLMSPSAQSTGGSTAPIFGPSPSPNDYYHFLNLLAVGSTGMEVEFDAVAWLGFLVLNTLLWVLHLQMVRRLTRWMIRKGPSFFKIFSITWFGWSVLFCLVGFGSEPTGHEEIERIRVVWWPLVPSALAFIVTGGLLWLLLLSFTLKDTAWDLLLPRDESQTLILLIPMSVIMGISGLFLLIEQVIKK